MRERGIERDWVKRTLKSPEWREGDPNAAGRSRAFARIMEFEDRWLRVVYETDGAIITVVTAFFDRKAGRWG
jgi:hypothetical protein